MDAHTQDLNRDHDRSERWCEAQELAMRRLDDGDFTMDQYYEACRRYWGQIRHCLSNREEQEFHKFVERGLLDLLTEEELDRV